jgi:alpha-galactosidase
MSNQKFKDKRTGYYVSRVNLSKTEKRLLHVMNKDVLRMMDVVKTSNALSKPDQEAVTRYLKLIKDLKAHEEVKAQDLPEEALTKIEKA